MCSRLTTEARAPQSCFMVPGEGAAGRAKALLGWVGRQGKTAAQLPHSSQPSRGRVLLAAGRGAALSLPCQAEFSWLFQRKAPISQAEGWSTGCWRGSVSCASLALKKPILASAVLTGLQGDFLLADLLTAFSTEVSTQLFRLLLYAFCIAWQAALLLYCVESQFFQFT